ncbi:MAG: enoyl-CoA hydratase-related protein [Proteobacteria bacterium]|nr:enoyl-CoA hydratase-related protein [Pseudomonadota bacterium]
MEYKDIICNANPDGVLVVTMNRPDKLNALSINLQEELVRALKEGENDPRVKVCVIKGAGRGFSSGYDIEPGGEVATRQRTILEDKSRLEKVSERWMKIWNLKKPVLAQVHGYCLGGGTDLALACDIILTSEDARFGHPGVRGLGLPLTPMWAYLVGPQWAKRMLFTGDQIDGREAERIGLALKAFPADKLEEEVIKLAGRMALVPDELLALNKALINRVVEEMGWKNVVQAACELDSISHFSPPVIEFWKILAEKGIKEAIKWRDGKFK